MRNMHDKLYSGTELHIYYTEGHGVEQLPCPVNTQFKMKLNKVKFDEQIELFYSERKKKDYYSCSDVMEITGISERTLRYRLKELAELYKDVPSLINKKNRKWRIHANLVDQFLPKYEPRVYTLANYDWKSVTTWITVDNYDEAYHRQLIYEVEQAYPDNTFHCVIEKTKKGINHVHIVSDAPSDKLYSGVTATLNQYIEPSRYRYEVEDIRNKPQIIRYLKK